jgi:hypothetical protein
MVHGQVTWTCTKGVPSWQPPLKRCVMSDEQGQDSSPLMPIEQQTIMFYSKPLVVVRLPDGRPGIVLRHLCDVPFVLGGEIRLRPSKNDVVLSPRGICT